MQDSALQRLNSPAISMPRQPHQHVETTQRRVKQLDFTTVQLHHPTHDGQAKACALPHALAEKALEEFLPQLRRNTRTTVLHAQQQSLRLPLQQHPNTPTSRGVLQGIAEQVLQQGAKARAIRQ